MTETQTLTLTEFLLARIAEDEAAARAAKDDYYARERWRLNTSRFQVPSRGARQSGEHIARHDPARVLAECEAKRSIVERCKFAEEHPDWAGDMEIAGHWDDAMDTLLDLASVYADDPGYRPEWAL